MIANAPCEMTIGMDICSSLHKVGRSKCRRDEDIVSILLVEPTLTRGAQNKCGPRIVGDGSGYYQTKHTLQIRSPPPWLHAIAWQRHMPIAFVGLEINDGSETFEKKY